LGCRVDEGARSGAGGQEQGEGRIGQRVRSCGSGIVRAPTTSTTSMMSTGSRSTTVTRGRVAKRPSRRGDRAGGRSRGASSSAGISRLSTQTASASSSSATTLSWLDVPQEQGLHSSLHQHPLPPPPQHQSQQPQQLQQLQLQRHPLSFTNAELAEQDILLGGTTGDLFGAPAPDPETFHRP